MFDGLVMVVLVFMGLRDDRRAPGSRQTSLFRTIDDEAGDAPPITPGSDPDFFAP